MTKVPAPRYLAAFLACVPQAGLWAQIPNPMTLSPTAASRGALFEIRITPAPGAANKKTIQLSRNGAVADAANVTFPAAAAGAPFATATVPDDLAFGLYQVIVTLDNRTYSAVLRLRPPGTAEIKLDKVDPDHTYSTETVWIAPDPQKPTQNVHSLRTVRLTLRGSNFLKHTPEELRKNPQDNTIWINGERQWVNWAEGCSAKSGTRDEGVAWGIHGTEVSSEQIELCHVTVPANGILLVSAAYGEPEPQTDRQQFTVYRMGTAEVAFISFGITAALTILVLSILWFVKTPYRIAGEDYTMGLLFLDKETDTYSLSKFQFYFWTLAAIFAYAYLYISKVYVQGGDWPDIPGTLPGIIGIGAGTAIGSQVVTAANGSKGAGPEKPGYLDFITSGGVVAADRIQMFLWTIFGVIAFCVGVLQKAPGTISGIAPVPNGMMYMMGLSAAGYLGGKMARNPGPVIAELSVTPAMSDRALAKAASATVDLPDFNQPSVAAAASLNGLPKVANSNAQKAIDAFAGAIKAAGGVHTTSDLANLLANLAGFRRDCESAAAAAAADFSATPTAASGQDAAAAQQAAAYLQDFSADVTQAISAAAAPSMDSVAASGSVPRVIELRGSNLAPDGAFEIGHADLPFRMLLNKDGQHAPEVVTRQDGGTFANVLRFSIDPAHLASTDLAQYQAWFGADATWVATLTNPDGQKADQSFSLPPATTPPS
jgi:hypothetical protein